jgi:DNA topoisomerase III
MPPRSYGNHRQGGGRITVLNVAEKPSVARSLVGAFARFPGARESAPMRREAAQIFTQENVQFPLVTSQGQGIPSQGPGVPHTMITTAVRGHLASTDFPPEYGWNQCDPIALFDAPLQTLYRDDMQALYEMLKRLSRQVDAVILWLDCDREGEAIGQEVADVCLQGNNRLQPHIYRARFSTVLEGEIRRALQTLGRLNQGFVQAVQARSELDLRVGAAFTRFQTLRLRGKFTLSENSSVVSYGPCQFPTLGFVVERWARIETFVPEDFWFLELTLQIPTPNENEAGGSEAAAHNNNSRNQNQNSNRPIIFSWKRQRIYDRLTTMILYENCLEAQQAVVTQLSGRPKRKWRPVPLATVELQKRASRYLRIGSETLMTAAEELYQQGYISYPRTETEKFSNEFNHRHVIQGFVNGNTPFSDYASHLLNDGGYQRPRNGQHDDQAHPPISPAKAVDPASITDPTQRSVYTLIVKHYLACCSQDAVGRETSITVIMASEEFTATGLMIQEKNWLEIYEPWERWSTGQGELPPVEVGSRVTPTSLLMKDGRTTAPLPISEVELISLMDRNGIGTDATIAQHISTIQDREYARKDGNQRFSPTPLGIALVEGYNSMGYQLNKPDLRRETEHECNLVANGQKTMDDIVGPILEKMKQCFITATAEAEKLDQAVARHFPRVGAGNNATVLQADFSKCGTCNNMMTLKQEGGGGRGGNNRNSPRKILYCNTCSVGWSLPRGQILPKTEHDNGGPPVFCPICQFQVIQVARGDGYEGNGYHACPKCFTDPPVDHGGPRNGGNFRCFSCTHPTCSLAGGMQGGDVEVFACPFCRDRGATGKVCLKKNSRGYILSCSNFSQTRCGYTIWLPKESQTVSVSEDENNGFCPSCSSNGIIVRKVSFVWKPGSVPPHLDRSAIVCVKCDVGFRQDMGISMPQANQVQSNSNYSRRQQQQPQQQTYRSNTGGGRGGGGRSSSSNSGAGSGRGYGGGRGSRGNGGAGGRSGSRGGRGNRHFDGRGSNFNAGGGGGRGNNNAGGIVCYRCQQPGHYANACPSMQ